MATASLAMYDGAAVRDANDLLWRLIADGLRAYGVADVPSALDRDRSLDAIWDDPDLLLAHCCGYPMMTRYRDRLRYVATPCYAAPGCAGAAYGSRIVVRADATFGNLTELREQRAAINERGSNTGANLFRGALAPIAQGAPFFAAVIETGSHRESLRAVVDGWADVAAIDTVTFALIARDEPALAERVRTIAETERVAGLPFVTSWRTPDTRVALLRTVIGKVIRSPAAAPARNALLIADVLQLPDDAYHRVLGIEDEARRLGYPELA